MNLFLVTRRGWRQWSWLVAGLLLVLGLEHCRGARVLLGNEVLQAQEYKCLQGKRIGLLTNPSGVNSHGRSTLEILRRAKGVKLLALFAAEHGLDGSIPAGTEFSNFTHASTGLPVYSLYGPGPIRKPTARMLAGLDALVYDLQDTGCRSYTFIATMGLAMEACAQAGVEFVVLDRPNPLGGERVEGARLDPQFKSMVSQWNVPYVYGLTCGELAQMINGEGWIQSRGKVTVVRMRGWQRNMVWRDTGLSWVPTSPYIRTGDAPLYYVATGVLGEIGGLSIGMNTPTPFQVIASPDLEARVFCRRLESYGLSGVRFRPINYTPASGYFRGQVIHGARIEVTAPVQAPLVAINYYALEAFKKVTGRNLLAEARKAGKSFSMFDKVNGTDTIRQALESGQSAGSIVRAWRKGEEAFRQQRKKYLLY
jgi:uncharacterized protein YbbC (DUF1343 family)